MSNVIPKGPQGLQTYQEDDWAGIAPPKLSRCTIGQPTSKAGKPGMFNFDRPDWPSVEKLEHVVILAPKTTRVLYGGQNGKARCASDDAITPSSRIQNPIWGSCVDCPLKNWDSDLPPENLKFKRVVEKEVGQAEAEKPLCTETRNVLVADSRLSPYQITFQKTNLKPIDKYLNALRFGGKRIFATACDVILTRKNQGRNTWYETEFVNPRPTENVEEFINLHAVMKQHGGSLLAEQHAQMDAEKDIQDEEVIPF